MQTPEFPPTIEQQRAYLQASRCGHEIAQHRQLNKWAPPSRAEKMAFDQLMQDVRSHRKSGRPCEMSKWYAALLRGRHE